MLNDLRQIQCRSCPEDQQGSAQPLAQPTPYASTLLPPASLSTSSQRCLTPHGPPLHTPPAAIPQTMSHSAPSPTHLIPASLSTSSQLSMVPHLSLATPHGLSRPTMPFPPYLPTPWPQTPFATSPHLSQQFPYPCIPPQLDQRYSPAPCALELHAPAVAEAYILPTTPDLGIFGDLVLQGRDATTVDRWVEIGGADPAKRSQVRLVMQSGAEGWGRGLAFFPWGNFKQLRRPGQPEVTMEFWHNQLREVDQFVLEPGDVIITTGDGYVWPFCIGCNKLLYPVRDHRNSASHRRWTARLQSAANQSDIDRLARDYLPRAAGRHHRN